MHNEILFSISSGGCYYMSEEMVSASEAAVSCGRMQGGRLASVGSQDELGNIATAAGNIRNKWIGNYLQGKLN